MNSETKRTYKKETIKVYDKDEREIVINKSKILPKI